MMDTGDKVLLGAVVVGVACLALCLIASCMQEVKANDRMKRAGYVRVQVENTTVWAKPEDIRAILSDDPQPVEAK